MALPATLNPSVPLGVDSPAQGDDEFRSLKQFVADLFGLTSGAGTSQTDAATTITSAGRVTISQTPFTVPSLIQGGVSQVLWLNATYTKILLSIATTPIIHITSGGLGIGGSTKNPTAHLDVGGWAYVQSDLVVGGDLQWDDGKTQIRGNSIEQLQFYTGGNSNRRWIITSAGHLEANVDNNYDVGTSSARPRDVYAARNCAIGVTSPTAILDVFGAGVVASGMHVGGLLRIADGASAGVAGQLTLGNTSNITISRGNGNGTIKFADGTSRNSVGFLTILQGPTTLYIPVFAAN